jgi:hypothetical protein
LHTADIPIRISYEVSSRIHANLSFGPSFHLLNTEISTETEYRSIHFYRTESAQVAVHPSPTVYETEFDITPPLVSLAAAGHHGDTYRTVAAVTTLHDPKLRKRSVASESSASFRCGFFTELGLSIDLDKGRRWFVDLHARYDYVPTVSVYDSAAKNTLNASSLGGGGGLGYRF